MRNLSLIFIILILSLTAIHANCNKAKKLYLANKYEQSILELSKSNCSNSFKDKLKGANYFKLFKTDSVLKYLHPYFVKKDLDDTLTIMLSESMLWIKDFKNSKIVLNSVKDKSFAFYRKVKIEQLLIEGNHRELIKYYNEGIKKGEWVLEYTLLKGKSYKWLKNYDEALKNFNLILDNKKSTNPIKLEALLEKSIIYSWKKEFGEALELIDDALVLDSNNVKVLKEKAKILQWIGEYKSAKKIYISILELHPSDADAKAKLNDLMWVN